MGGRLTLPGLTGRPRPSRGDAKAYGVLSSGLFAIPDDLRSVCAPFSDGRVVVKQGHRFDAAVGQVLETMVRAHKVSPNVEEESSETIADLWAQSAPVEEESNEQHRRYVAQLLQDAAEMNASDLKIIRRSRHTDIRVAVAGREITYREPLDVRLGREIIAYLFDARDEGSGHTTKQNHVFQSFSLTPGHSIPLPDRIQKIRGQKGFHEGDAGIQEHMVLRIVYGDNRDVRKIEDLGFDPLVLADLGQARDRIKGAVIIGGETGNGKSTTIIRAVERLYEALDGQISVVTIEDPVETRIRQPGVIQIPIQSSGSAEERRASFQAALRHFVRINPHVGVVSEVRDAEGARQMVQFIETGHQVWTTIHIGSVNSILFRMIDMGLDPTEVAKPESITLLMRQSLVPLLCGCSLQTDEQNPFRERNPNGCDQCRAGRGEGEASGAWAGYRRLIAVAETIVPDDDYLDCVRRNDAIAAWQYWTKSLEAGGLGGLTLDKKINYLVNAGLVSPIDARKKGVDVCRVADERMGEWQTWMASLV